MAVQGELIGECIQGNREGIKGTTLFIFDAFDIDEQRYLTPKEREYFVDALYKNNYVSEVVPVYHRNVRLADIGIHNIDDLITFADGKSLMTTKVNFVKTMNPLCSNYGNDLKIQLNTK